MDKRFVVVHPEQMGEQLLLGLRFSTIEEFKAAVIEGKTADSDPPVDVNNIDWLLHWMETAEPGQMIRGFADTEHKRFIGQLIFCVHSSESE